MISHDTEITIGPNTCFVEQRLYHNNRSTIFSLNTDNNYKVISNKIEDIIYTGIQECFRVIVDGGNYIDVTKNVIFINKKTYELKIGDLLYCLKKFHQTVTQLPIVSIISIGKKPTYKILVRYPYNFATKQNIFIGY